MGKATQGTGAQAADWVIRLEDGLTQTETLAFVGWLRASPVHIREYLQAEAAWYALEGVDSQRRIDIDALLTADDSVVPFAGKPLSREEQTGAAAAIRRSRTHWWAIAAGLVLAAVAIPLLWYANGLRTQVYTTALGEQRTIVLEDGSVMELNTASEVAVRFSGAVRDVEMAAGEAFFTVKKEAARPFRVYSNGVEVQAVGTQFNVYRHAEQTVVSVLEGRVRVLPAEESATGLELAVGNQVVVAPGRQSVTADADAMMRALAWRERKLVFADEPLVNVVAEINRYNARQLTVNDPRLASRRISGVFNVHDPEVIVRFLTRSAGVSVTESADRGWVLAAKPGEVSANQ